MRATIAVGFVVLAACYLGSGDDDGPAQMSTSGGDGDGSSGASAGPDGGPADDGGPGPGDDDTAGDDPGDDDTAGETSDPPPTGPLLDRVLVVDLPVPEGVKPGVNNWRIWGTGSLHVAPVFTIPISSCDTLVGYTTAGAGTITARVTHIGADDALVTTLDLGSGLELRGLAGEDEGLFGALLWSPSEQRIWIKRYDLSGAEQWSSELTNPDNTPTDFGIGDSRLEYGDGTYGAYYHVHSDSGHEGDTLKWANAQSGAPSTGWGWGCSHSMSNLLRFHAGVGAFMSACVTDCFPGTSGDFATNSIGGIYVDHDTAKVMDVAAGCNGSVAGELGSAAFTPGGWAMVFNAHQAPATFGQQSYNPATMDQDIGLSFIASDLTPSPVVWLTSTPGVHEADASIERWQPHDDPSEQYVVGWHEPGAAYRLARIDPSGAWLEGPVDATGIVAWGRRDDPFRRHDHGDIVWSWFDEPASTTLHFARLRAGNDPACR